ncbi:hypothetical protein [Gordonia sp. (in: high G+C Gram-positive bacteria)]|uniref:hypothetical protein n=1 Tax=Gordonia sp. (in: high G+C Gram-positive bacteria) TaxID=84139 RepID=UPI003526D9DD
MVRPDHEDGGVLSSDDEIPKPAGPVVRKTSPLGRKTKKPAASAIPGYEVGKAAPIPGAATSGADDAETTADGEETAEVLTSAAETTDTAETAETTGTAETPDTTETPDTAEIETGASGIAAADRVGYRDRRVAAQRRRSAREAAGASRTSRVSGGAARRAVALILAVIIIVTGTVLSIVFGMRYQTIAHQRELRAQYATFARQVVVDMTTLNSDNADAMYKLAMNKTSGRAQQVFRDNMKQVTDMIRKADAVTQTNVLSEAVSEATDKEGTVLMVVGWTSKTKDGKTQPLFQTFRYQVGMTRINGDLKVTDLEFVW